MTEETFQPGPLELLAQRLCPPAVEEARDVLICATCLETTYRSRALARDALKQLADHVFCPSEHPLDPTMAALVQLQDCPGSPFHRQASATFLQLAGFKRDPELRRQLLLVDPRAAESTRRFPERRPVGEVVLAELARSGRRDLLQRTADARSCRYIVGERSRAVGGDHERSLAELFLSQPIARTRISERFRDVAIAAEHGLPLLFAEVLAAGPRRLAATDERNFTERGGDVDTNLLDWQVLDVYLALQGQHRLIRWLDATVGDTAPVVAATIASSTLPPNEQATLLGDLAVLRHAMRMLSDRSNDDEPSSGKLPALFSHLKAIRYERIELTADRDNRQRFSQLIRAIAAPLERVRLWTVDWSLVLGLARFSHQA